MKPARCDCTFSFVYRINTININTYYFKLIHFSHSYYLHNIIQNLSVPGRKEKTKRSNFWNVTLEKLPPLF